MKKQIAALFVAIVCLCLVACGGDNGPTICAHENIVSQNGIPATCTTDGMSEGKVCAECGTVLVEQTKIPATGHNIVTVPGKEPTCTAAGSTEGQQCSNCDMVVTAPETIPALGHTEGWDCERCDYSSAAWKKFYFVDEFNDPTSDWYIGLKYNATGTFSNSATNDSRLDVYILYSQADNYPNLPFDGIPVGKEYFNIFLYEYGDLQVKNSSTYYVEEYTIKIKTESGKVYELKGIMPTSQDRIWIYDHDLPYDSAMAGTNASELKQILMEGGTLKFILIHDERPVEQYTFELDTSNFKDAVSNIG